MSWDIVLFKNKIDLSDNGSEPEPIGDRRETIKQLLIIEPDIDFNDEAWGIYFDGETSIELNIGDENNINVIMLHVRGSGNPFKFIAKICRHFRWHALDGSTGDWINIDNSSNDSWDRWQNYRDKIKGQ